MHDTSVDLGCWACIILIYGGESLFYSVWIVDIFLALYYYFIYDNQ